MQSWSHFALCLSLGLSAACTQFEGDGIEIGESTAEVVGGIATTKYPAVALLYSEFSASDDAQLCSGTLISPRVILTAAHCVEFQEGEPEQYLAYFGTNLLVENDPGEIDTVAITGYEYHPDWNIDNLEAGNDIGLVRLERAVRPQEVTPMRFNREPLEDRLGEEVHLVGWGRTTGDGDDFGVKREAKSSLQGAEDLLIEYGSSVANTCQGDSGGPNFMSINGIDMVAGITSYGNVGCNDYGVGTRVDKFAAFIDDYIQRNDPSGAGPPIGGDPEEGTDQTGTGAADGEGGDPVNGGCSAGGSAGPRASLGFALLLLAMSGLRLVRRRVRAHRS